MANITRRGNDWSRFLSTDFLRPDSFFDNNWLSRWDSFPAVNISENDKEYEVELVAPGFTKEDFKIKVDDDILTISAESKQESKNGKGEGDKKEYTRREYSYQAFTRSFRLPENVKDDSIQARYTDGVLKLTMPKSKTQVKATKEIAIN